MMGSLMLQNLYLTPRLWVFISSTDESVSLNLTRESEKKYYL